MAFQYSKLADILVVVHFERMTMGNNVGAVVVVDVLSQKDEY